LVPDLDRGVCEGGRPEPTAAKLTFDRNLAVFEAVGTQTRAVAHATPVYMRGLWFNGVSSYVELQDFILNPTFSLNIWVRQSGTGNLFSINLP
jgi:hypothetical protein